MVAGGELVLEAVGIDLPRELLLQALERVRLPFGRVVQERVEERDAQEAVQLHEEPVAVRRVVAQTPPVLPDGDEVAREELVRHLRRLRERRDLAAPAGHADARLDRAPAVRGAGTGLLRHERLVEPAGDHVDPHGDGLLVAGGGVVLGERRPEWMARELPGPLLVLVERGVEVPVHLVVREVVRHAAGGETVVHDLPGAALERAQRLALVFPLEPVLVERVVPQRGAHVVREHLLGAGEVARGHLRGDGRQRGDGRVEVFREELLGRGARTDRARFTSRERRACRDHKARKGKCQGSFFHVRSFYYFRLCR